MIRRIDASTVNRVLAAITLFGLTLLVPVFAADTTRVVPQAAVACGHGQGGGDVQPATAKPRGYSLTRMLELMALFNSSGNPDFYPETPFQILHTGQVGHGSTDTTTPIACPQPPGGTGLLFTGGNTFVVKSGTPFFVPIYSFDDSPPIVGDFPSNKSQAADYVFGPRGFGARNTQVIVDGVKTSVGPKYLAGPVKTPPLLNGGGTHMIQLGVFLTPMSVGTHMVAINGEVAGNALFDAYHPFDCFAEDATYVVKVLPRD